MTGHEVSFELSEAHRLETSFRDEAGRRLHQGDHVTVVDGGGFFAQPDVITLYPSLGGLWRLERITQRTRFRHGNAVVLPVEVRTSDVSAEQARRVSDLLSQDALYEEPVGLRGVCTDQPSTVLEIAWKGRRRDAVRLACPPDDLTWHLIEAVWDAAEAAKGPGRPKQP